MTKFVVNKMPNPIKTGSSNFTPEGSSGQDDRSRVSTMDLSISRNFCAVVLYDFLGGKSYQERLASFAIYFLLSLFFFFFGGGLRGRGGGKSPAKFTVTKRVQRTSVWTTDRQ